MTAKSAASKPTAGVKPVYALVGDDSFLQVQELTRILSTMPADVQRIDLDGERTVLSDVLDELRSFAMFGGAKLVVVRSADEFISRYREQVEDYLAQPADSGTLVLRVNSLPKNTRVYKLIGKVGEVIECTPPKPYQLPQWIAARARDAHKIKLSPDTAAMLAELVGADLGRLDNEMAKIAVMCGEKPMIQPADIHGCVAFQREQEMWDMTNELAMGRPADALKRWRQLLQLDPSVEFRAVTWLTMWLEEVNLILSGGNTGKLTWKYKDRLPQVVNVARQFGKSRYARAVDLLAEVDRRSKSGLGDATSNVERFILSLNQN